jgi:hypothetical protein
MRTLSVVTYNYTLDLLAKARLIFIFTAVTVVGMIGADIYTLALAG